MTRAGYPTWVVLLIQWGSALAVVIMPSYPRWSIWERFVALVAIQVVARAGIREWGRGREHAE